MQDKDFDKSIQGKLAGNEAAFNSADWDKMDAMLDDDRTVAAWWLPVALLLLGILIGGSGVYLAMNIFNQGDQKVVEANTPEIHKFMSSSEEKEVLLASNSEELCDEILQAESGKWVKEKLQAIGQDELVSQKRNQESNTEENDFEAATGHDSRARSKTNSNKWSASNNNNGAHENTVYPGTSASAENQTKEPVLMASAQEVIFTSGNPVDKIGLDRLKPYVLINNSPAIDQDIRLKGVSRPLITAGFGVFGGTGLSFTKTSTLQKPSYEAGLRQEIIFKERVGLSFSESFTVNNFHFRDLDCEGANCPQTIDIKTRSLEFLVDLKANLVNKKQWSYYAKVGYGSVLNLDNQIDYNFKQVDTIAPSPTNLNNSFTGTLTPIELDQMGYTDLKAGTVSDEALDTEQKKYQGYLHFASGIEVHKNRFAFQLECGYKLFMDRNSLLQERSHNIGLNAGVFYRLNK